MNPSETRISTRLHRAVFCFAVCVCPITVFGCSSSPRVTPPITKQPVTLSIGFPTLTGEDPLRGIQEAARLISLEGLVSLARDGHAIPRLAERWASSADGLAWTIDLRPNAMFHDGTPVDSAAVKSSLERSLASADRDLTPGLADISTIDTPSARQLVIHLKERSTFVLDDLTVSITKPGEGKARIGAGPYVTSAVSNGQISMNAFSKYYRGQPFIDKVVWKPYPTVRTAWAAMMRGEVDFLYEVGQDAREFIQGENSIRVFPFLRNYVYGVALNSRRPVFQDRRIREALNYAIDRAAIVEQAFKGHARPSSGSAWPEHWAFDNTVPNNAYDPQRSTALLDAAGVNATRVIPGGFPARIRFTCLLPQNFALWERMALIVQRNLSDVGVDMQLESLPAEEFNARITKGDFDAGLLEFIVGNSASRPYFFWYSQSRMNVWGYKNPNLDAAFDAMRRASSDAEYRSAFRQFQIETSENPPAIFLALGENSRAVSKRFQVVAPPGSDILPTIADWRLADAPETTN